MADEVRKQIEAFRRKLLDLTMRNRMLNYRLSVRLGLEVVGESSIEVLRILVEESRPMTFTGQPDPPKRLTVDELRDVADEVAMAEYRARAEEELDAYLESPATPVEKLDRRLATKEYTSHLALKLRAIQREAHLAQEELGINTLFLTLGSLEWSGPDDRTFRAPLIYVPVKLEHRANGSLRLIHDGSDPGENLPLRHKLAELDIKLPDWDDEKPVYEFFNELTSTIKHKPEWRVHPDDIFLGFFNYEKFAMYMDLSGEHWPDDRKPWMDEDLKAMLGSGYVDIPDDLASGSIDPVRPPEACHEVYDADSSQAIALIRAGQGISMVIEGPPGTGKSQTITNIIAEAVAAGRTVLFVSAKRAAVEVVKRRLTDAGLGEMCLDLHDKLTNRKQFYSEIRRTVGRTLQLKDETQRVERFAELREKLNAHAEAVNNPLPAYGLSPFEAMIELSRLPSETADDRDGRIPFEKIKGWNKSDAIRFEPITRALQRRVSEIGIPAAHPYWGCRISFIDPAIRLDLQSALPEAFSALAEADEKLGKAASAFGISGLDSAADVRILESCVAWGRRAHGHLEVAIRADDWEKSATTIERTLALLEIRNDILSRLQGQVNPATWSTDITPVTQAYIKHSGKLLRFLVGEFRVAKSQIPTILNPGAALDDLSVKDILVDICSARTAQIAVEEAEPLMSRLFGKEWRGLDSDPQLIRSLLNWVLQLREDVSSGAAPTQVLDYLESQGPTPEHESWLEIASNETEEALAAYKLAAANLDYPTDSALDESIASLRERVAGWQASLPNLASYVNFSEARRQAQAAGLGAVVDLADRWPLAGDRLTDAVKRSYYLGVVRDAMEKRPALRTFERVTHEEMIREFRDLDDFSLKYNRARVRIAHHRAMPTFDQAAGNLRLLKVQCELQRSHKPIRWIMSRAGEAVQRIKPVFMMSPLSVAIHLPPDLPPFDVVIFDEASQVKPEDALCAIVRAKQTIVVGDTRQMPPTNFFDRVGDGEDFEAEDEETELAQESAKLESILSLMSSVVLGRARRPDLQWHYRSIHPGLIQPSNQMFYDGRLIVFPSADSHPDGSAVGTIFHHHPETIYEAGSQKRINRREAEIVADAVLRHVQTEPHLSLMVAAMNKPQADLIHSEVQKRERRFPEAFAAYRPANASETIEIKNLETVQGDERDVVFISVTYGRGTDGLIRQHFGPILKGGGERRLNVLISRARRRCEVFSNITAEDIRTDADRVGLTTLKRYLDFAENGRWDAKLDPADQAQSPFERELSNALRGHGYEVESRLGSEGFSIDLAVRDPEATSRFLLGIETDGPSYCNARSARDRDKLQERVLRDRGWQLHRIWCHDWWQDKESEIARVLGALAPNPVETTPIDPAPTDSSPTEPTATADDFVDEAARSTAATPRYSLPPPLPELVEDRHVPDLVVSTVRDEGPIHYDLLMIRLRTAQGLARLGPAARALYEDAIFRSIERGAVKMIADAFIRSDEQLKTVRDWSDVPDRKSSYVTGIELSNALVQAIRTSYGLERADAAKAAWTLLGFKRVGGEAIAEADIQLEALISSGHVREQNGLLVVT